MSTVEPLPPVSLVHQDVSERMVAKYENAVRTKLANDDRVQNRATDTVHRGLMQDLDASVFVSALPSFGPLTTRL
jgi:hypothetical protein